MASLNEINGLVSSRALGRNIVQLTKEEAELFRDERIAAFNERCVFVKPNHTAWLVLQRLRHTLGKSFTASSIFETKTEAEMYASAFGNIVAIMPIEWEE